MNNSDDIWVAAHLALFQAIEFYDTFSPTSIFKNRRRRGGESHWL